MPNAKRILVTGDYCADYDIYLQTNEDNPPLGTPPTQINVSVGGAGIAWRVLKSVAALCEEPNKIEVGFSRNPENWNAPPTAALWHKVPFGKVGKTIDDNKATVWRVRRSLSLGQVLNIKPLPPLELPETIDESFSPNIILVEDNAGGFRFKLPNWLQKAKEASGTAPEWIVFKTSAPVGYGQFWWELSTSKELCEKLVVVVSINHLRLSEIRVSQTISWERTALDLARELSQSPLLEGLRRARHVIVTLYGDGALWMERSREEPEKRSFTLFFDPGYMEGEWAQEVCGSEGNAYGFHSTYAGALAAHLALNGEGGLPSGIGNGLRAMRLLRVIGHGLTKESSPGLPVEALAPVILGQKIDDLPAAAPRIPKIDFDKLDAFGQATIPGAMLNMKASESEAAEPCSTPGKWRILEASENRPAPEQPLYGLGRRVAMLGLKGLVNVPYACFGKLFTADRDEIEALRNIQRLIQDYENNESETKPLSIAVFGPPGSGKSFAIKQIAETTLRKKKSFLEFNLSQFGDNQDLIGAFHQVRDKVLEGGIPIVFLDEFDSQNYKWLQYLLAPMQDGKFQEGQITHPIGRCILVFAGATSYNAQSFGPLEKPWSQSLQIMNEHKQAAADFKLKKGPDFKSRLHGILNVLGPNRRQAFNPANGPGEQWVDDPADICFPVRRAILLRSWLGMMDPKEKESSKRLSIDSGLLAALLEVDHYTHGARSMEKIVATVKQGSKGEYHRSALPTDEVLGLNVKEPGQFIAIMNQPRAFQRLAQSLARAIHSSWAEIADRQNAYNVGFDKLGAEAKGDNYAAAARIPILLGLIGLQLVEEDANQEAVENVEAILESHLEPLAEEEHIGWMEVKQANGWVNAPRPKDIDEENAQRLQYQHHCLVPYAELSENDKDKDRTSIRKIPTIAQIAKYKIVVRQPLTK